MIAQPESPVANTAVRIVRAANLCIIEVPPKVWRPKVINKYIPVDYADDIDDGIFDFECYGKTFFRPKGEWSEGTRTDIIAFDPTEHSKELKTHLKVGSKIDTAITARVIDIIKRYWDSFCTEGAKRPILGFEFAIDTGNAKPVSCGKKQYGPYESDIIMKQVQALLDNEWIYECEGPWSSMIVLAPKPHQEHVVDIKEFIWRMCVSYRKLNSITKPFEYPIPRCDDAISVLMIGGDEIWIITVDARQGYHQVAVRKVDQEKLAFFAPNHKKYTWNVMPFGPTNAPAYYTAMMNVFQTEWNILFLETVRRMDAIDGRPVTVTEDGSVFISKKRISTGSKVIIDDILAWSNDLGVILIYLECICRVFQKYRVSFRLDKCEFLKDRVEYVGHDLTPTGNCPAASKFKNMITDWSLPETGQSLHSFIGLVNFYARYCPFFEVKLKPLRKLLHGHYRQVIPLIAWTPELIELFNELKVDITSSPVLRRFDPSRPTFLKTDWSAEGMGWILMQPANDDDSRTAMETLKETGECLFNLTTSGPRLQAVAYGSRSCTDMEKLFHSFVGEAACGRWAIGQNRRFLWGNHFYWMCDCRAMKEVLEYDGTIAMVSRWAQELLGYHFTVIHRHARMMIDVDGLTRRFGRSITTHIMIAALLAKRDAQQRPLAYTDSLKNVEKPTKIKTATDITPQAPILTHTAVKNSVATHQQQSPSTASPSIDSHAVLALYTDPIKIQSTSSSSKEAAHLQINKCSTMFQAVESLAVRWICVDDCLGSMDEWSHTHSPPPMIWNTTNVFTSSRAASLYAIMYPDHDYHISDLSTLHEHDKIQVDTAHGIDVTFIPHIHGSILDWLNLVMMTLSSTMTHSLYLCQATIWIRSDYLSNPLDDACRDLVTRMLPPTWSFAIYKYNTAEHGDRVAALRTGIQFFRLDNCQYNHSRHEPYVTPFGCSYGALINTAFHDSVDDNFVPIPLDVIQNCGHTKSSHPWIPISLCSSRFESSHRNKKELGSIILDPEFPATEPTQGNRHSVFGNRFGIPFQQHGTTQWQARAVSSLELLRMYSIPDTALSNPKLLVYLDTDALLDELLPSAIPHQFRYNIMSSMSQQDSFYDAFTYGEDAHVNSIQCFAVTTAATPPQTLNWTHSYSQDSDTSTIMKYLQETTAQDCPPLDELLKSIGMGFRKHLKDGRFRIQNGKLILLQSILADKKAVILTVVPDSLRKKLFDHYHAGPTGGHMGEHKTLFRMRLRFFWPKMRSDI